MICFGFWPWAYALNHACRRESLPAQTARLLSGTQSQASPTRQSHPPDPRVAQPTLQLAKRLDHRDARNLRQLASQRLPAFLALEMPIRPAAYPAGTPTVIRRIAGENPSWARSVSHTSCCLNSPARVATHGSKIPAKIDRTKRQTAPRSALVNFSQASRPSHHRLRFLHGSDCHFSDSLRLCGHGTGFTPHDSHQRHRPSKRSLDPPANA